MSHAGSRLLADVADTTTLTGELSEVLAGLRRPRARRIQRTWPRARDLAAAFAQLAALPVPAS